LTVRYVFHVSRHVIYLSGYVKDVSDGQTDVLEQVFYLSGYIKDVSDGQTDVLAGIKNGIGGPEDLFDL